jgi:hypothetical protein
MKSKRPTQAEIEEATEKLAALREALEREGAHVRAATVGSAIDLIHRLSPSKGDGHP